MGLMKKIRVNSIRNSSVLRILKPCEARGGHGVLALLVALGMLGLLVAVIWRPVWRFAKHLFGLLFG